MKQFTQRYSYCCGVIVIEDKTAELDVSFLVNTVRQCWSLLDNECTST